MKNNADLKFLKRSFLFITVILCGGFAFMVYSVTTQYKTSKNTDCLQNLGEIKGLKLDRKFLGMSIEKNKIFFLLGNNDNYKIIIIDGCSGKVIKDIKIKE